MLKDLLCFLQQFAGLVVLLQSSMGYCTRFQDPDPVFSLHLVFPQVRQAQFEILDCFWVLSRFEEFPSDIPVEQSQEHIRSSVFVLLESFLNLELIGKFFNQNKIVYCLLRVPVNFKLGFRQSQFSFQIQQRVRNFAALKDLNSIKITQLCLLQLILAFLLDDPHVEKDLGSLSALAEQLFSDFQSLFQIFQGLMSPF